MIHWLKTKNPWFEEVADFDKTFEIRENDRKFEVDDILILAELSTDPNAPPRHDASTEKAVICRVRQILTHEQFKGLAEGYVAMSLQVIGMIMPVKHKWGHYVDSLNLFEYRRTSVESSEWTSTHRREPEKKLEELA